MEREQESTLTEKPGYMTCAQWVAKYGWPTIGGLRWMVFRAKNDPILRKTFIRVKRRILIKEHAFLSYLEEMNEKDLSGEANK
jgi:hypothetical protein